jgi:holo-[acyl-carrier protein] synthase
MIGIDIVKIERIEQLLKKHPARALSRILSEEERKLAKTPQTVAGFFAAKEAVAKALGCGISSVCGFHDIRIHKDENGAPWFTLSPHLIDTYSITECALSITHDGGFAVAVAAITTTKENGKPLCH